MAANDILPHEKEIYEYVKAIEHLKKKSEKKPLFVKEIQTLEKKLEKLKKEVYSKLTPWERIAICRHSNRPRSTDYFSNICQKFIELHGDRLFGDDHAIVGGIGQIDEMKCILIGQEKGKDTESRVYRNFGMPHPEGFRKALRLMQLAEKFQLPVISLIDTPGAFPGLEAEERGQAWAIAQNLREMAQIATPILVVIIGEGCSGGALGTGVGDVVAMLEHSYYSVITPEGCASILWKDSSKNKEAALALKLNAEELKSFDIIDTIIEEPLGGAHTDFAFVFKGVKEFLLDEWHILRRLPKEILLQQRYLKYRKIGIFETKSS